MLDLLLPTQPLSWRRLGTILVALGIAVGLLAAAAASAHPGHLGHGGKWNQARVPGEPDFVRIGNETRRYDPATRSYLISRQGRPTATAHYHPEPRVLATAGSHRQITQTEDQPVCAKSGHRIVVVRTYSSLDPQTPGGDQIIRSYVRRMNAKFMQQSNLSSGGARTLQMKVDCSAAGTIQITNIEIPSNYTGQGIDTTDNDVNMYDAGNAVFRALGYPEKPVPSQPATWDGRQAVKYLVFHDDGGSGRAGLSLGFMDPEKNTSDNYLASNSNSSRVGSTWSALMIGSAIDGVGTGVHELLHGMGATFSAASFTPEFGYETAPFANAGGHCDDGIDVLCYGFEYDETQCPESAGFGTPDGVPIDCNYNTYFDARSEPGEWLDRWWNLGGVENPYLVDHDTRFESDVDGYLRSDLVTLSTSGTAYTYRGFGGQNPHATSFGGSMNSALYDGTGHHVIDVEDVNGDGKSDMVTMRQDGKVYVYPGQYTGAFGSGVLADQSAPPVFYRTSESLPGWEPVAVADVTGDGRGDLVSYMRWGGSTFVETSPGLADGTFGAPESSPVDIDSVISGGEDGYLLDAADVDGDGHADLVAARDEPGSGGEVVVYRGNADGEFDPAGEDDLDWLMRDGWGHEPVGLGDVNGDGRADLVTLPNNGTVYVFGGRTDASFDTSSVSGTSFSGSMNSSLRDETGDDLIGVFDESGDGYADLLVARQDGSIARYEGTQDYLFKTTPRVTAPPGFSPNRFEASPGHEIVIEKPAWRRIGCQSTGCPWPPFS